MQIMLEELPAEPLLVPVDVARRLLGIGRTKTYQLIAAGKLIARKLGAKTLIEFASVRQCAAALPVVRPNKPKAPTAAIGGKP